jgi:hypothetical protein
MPFFRPWSLAWVSLTACALGAGCGGSLAPVGPGGDAGMDVVTAAPEASTQDAPAYVDAITYVDAPVTIDAIGPCQVDGVPCITAGQCCSNVCDQQICGGATPTCLADGTACTSAEQCCSGECNGECGVSTQPSCPIDPNATSCEVCVAEACCTDELACETDAVCADAQQCFINCRAAGASGGTCAQTCIQENPSTSAETLFQCAASNCASTCE